jgi:hypothetical protein
VNDPSIPVQGASPQQRPSGWACCHAGRRAHAGCDARDSQPKRIEHPGSIFSTGVWKQSANNGWRIQDVRPTPTNHGSVLIRSISATPFVPCALNPLDGSNSSSLTSTNGSLLTSPQPEKRKVAARRTIGRVPEVPCRNNPTRPLGDHLILGEW